MAEYALIGQKWSGGPITWSYEHNNYPTDSYRPFSNSIDDPTAKALVQQAFSKWQSVSGTSFLELEDSSTKSEATDIRVGLANFGASSGTIGLTYYNYFGANLIPDVTVQIQDPAFRPLTTDQTGALTYVNTSTAFYQVVLHEIGHALGLNHSTDPVAVMCPVATSLNRDLSIADIEGIQAIYGAPAPAAAPSAGPTLIQSLNASQQLELVYIGYFNRSADGSGLSFWAGQNLQAQLGGQSANDALKNISNAFTPQAETYSQYPFLSSSPNLRTVAAQTSLSALVDNIYHNLFNRVADAAGKAYWVVQLTIGTVSLGNSILTIANGAIGQDATVVQNKIAVALDFSQRTQVAGLGVSVGYTSLTSGFLGAAKNVLSGVDGSALDDGSVTAGKAATTGYVAANTIKPPAVVAMKAMDSLAPIDTALIGLGDTVLSVDDVVRPALPANSFPAADLSAADLLGIAPWNPTADELSLGNLAGVHDPTALNGQLVVYGANLTTNPPPSLPIPYARG